MKKSKRILTILGMSAGLALVGVNANSNQVHADTINDAVYTTTQTTYVYRNINNPVKPIQTLNANTNWKIIRTAYDKFGNKWLDLGKNQWVKVEASKTSQVVENAAPQQAQTQAAPVQTQSAPTQTYQAQRQAPSYQQSAPAQAYQARRQTPSYQQSAPIQTYRAPRRTFSYRAQNRPVQYSSKVSASANSGLASIAQAESGNSYTARNGQYIGKYQLSASYLHGDFSPANQERVARQYAISRYGSIGAAAAFHQAHGWW